MCGSLVALFLVANDFGTFHCGSSTAGPCGQEAKRSDFWRTGLRGPFAWDVLGPCTGLFTIARGPGAVLSSRTSDVRALSRHLPAYRRDKLVNRRRLRKPHMLLCEVRDKCLQHVGCDICTALGSTKASFFKTSRFLLPFGSAMTLCHMKTTQDRTKARRVKTPSLLSLSTGAHQPAQWVQGGPDQIIASFFFFLNK